MKKALPALQDYIKLKSDDARAWELIFKVYSRLNMKEEATKAYDELDKINKSKK